MQNLEHVKKLVLIPHESYSRLQDKPIGRTTGELASGLDNDISKILSQKAEDSEKWRQYQQTLQRYLYFVKEQKKPLEILTTTLDPTESPTSQPKNDTLRATILNIVPKKSQSLASSFFDFIASPRAQSVLSWDETGALRIDGAKVQNGNIIDLVSDTVRSRRKAHAIA